METCRIWNPTEETVSTKMHGAWFTFAPGAYKTMDETKAAFIKENRKGTGLVVLPNQFNPSSEQYVEGFDKTDEGKKIMAEARATGIRNLIDFHMDIIRNNQVSLRNDLAPKSPGVDPVRLAALNASEGEIKAMQIVAKYKGKAPNSEAEKLGKIDKLMNEIGPLTAV